MTKKVKNNYTAMLHTIIVYGPEMIRIGSGWIIFVKEDRPSTPVLINDDGTPITEGFITAQYIKAHLVLVNNTVQ